MIRISIRRRVTVAVTAMGLVAAACGGGTGSPPTLRLQTSGAGAERAGASNMMMPYESVTYRAGDGLPTLGGSGPVFSLAEPTDARITQVADAFGVNAPVTSAQGARVVSDGTWVLSVYGTSWSLLQGTVGPDGTISSSGGGTVSGCAEPDRPVSSDGTSTDQPPADGTGPDDTTSCTIPEPVRPAGMPTRAAAEARVLSIADAVGLQTAAATTEAFDNVTSWSVSVHPKVADHRSSGYGLTVSIGPDEVVLDGWGSVGTLTELDTYPVIDTSTGIAQLNEHGPFHGSGSQPMGADIAVASGPTEGAPAGTSPGGTVTEDAPPSSTITGDPGTEEPMPPPSDVLPDPGSGGTVPPPRDVMVTLSEAGVVYTLVGAWDGSATYLVPTYALSGTDQDGNRREATALAIDSAFLEVPADATEEPGSDTEG